jgi:amidase
MSLSWEAIAQKAQSHRDATIALIQPSLPCIDIKALHHDSTPIPKTILTSEEISITESSPTDLVSQLASGALSSTVVTSAFLRRAAIAQILTNCVTELLPTSALSRAAFLDHYLKEHGHPMGPLHGLPISVKEHVAIQGLSLNGGFVAWHDRIADANAHILDVLLDAGAVLYVRTTEPQTLMHLETDNNLYGVTVNAFNRNLTAGGSSGGEGALVGMRGSCLGIGTDIGGSIRYDFSFSSAYTATKGDMYSIMLTYLDLRPQTTVYTVSAQHLTVSQWKASQQQCSARNKSCPSLVPYPLPYPV